MDNSAEILKGDSVIFGFLKANGLACLSCVQKADSAYVTSLSRMAEPERSSCLNALISRLDSCSCNAKTDSSSLKRRKKIFHQEVRPVEKTNADKLVQTTTLNVKKTKPAARPARPRNGVYAPGAEELAAIQIQYKDVTLNKLTEGHAIYTRGPCIKCHGVQNIYKRAEREWKDIIELMAVRAKISDEEKDAVYKYVLAIKATQNKKFN